MKVQHTWKYLSLLAVLGFWGCSTPKNLAGQSDDLYGSSADAPVYASSQREPRSPERNRTASQRYEDSRMNANPDYSDQSSGLPDDEYYSEVTARKVTRGLSADPGWSSDNTYTNGFANGYNTAMMNSSWNRWGWNSPFYGGLRLGIGMGMSPWSFNNWGYNSFYSPFNSFYGGGYAYNPFNPFYGGGGFYDSFYSPYGYGYNSFYSPYSYGGYGRPVIVNNYNNIGASRNTTYGARRGVSRDRYNSDFVNTPRNYNNTNNGGRRSGELNSSNNTATNNTYYSRPNNSGSTNSYGAGRSNSRGADYYYGGSGNSGRASAENSSSRPTYSAPSNSDYYAAPRQNSRGSYTPPSYNSGSRSGVTQQTPTYQAPTRTYEAPQRTYSPPSQPSYSSPSYGGSRGGSSSSGGGSYSGGGGGGSRGPR